MTKFRDYSLLELQGDVTNYMNLRMENDVNGNPVYVGYSTKGDGGTAAAIWFIVKITYDANQSPTRQQLPNAGVSFDYIWDDRATYFS